MRITASWLDPPVGSTEYKDVARDLRCHPWAGSPQIVSALLAALRRAIATRLGGSRRGRVWRRARAGQGVAWKCCAEMNDLATAILDRPCARRAHETAGRDGRMGSAAGSNKRIRKEER
jgi:hypothetical protein